jgi:hypothetical protein
VGLIRALNDFADVPVFPALFAWVLAEADRTAEAETLLAEARQADFGGVRYDYLWLCTLMFLSRACARLGDAGSATELYERLRPHHATFGIGQAVWPGPVAYDLGLLTTVLGRYDDADAYFAEAVEMHDSIGVRGMLAHTHLAWARVLIARRLPGDTQRAREQLQRAQATANELGALENIGKDAAALLRELS